MKFFLKCPICQNKKTMTLEHKLTSHRLKEFFSKNPTTCEVCNRNALGSIVMNVVGFDHENNDVGTVNEADHLHVPIHLDPEDMTEEQIAKREKLRVMLRTNYN